MSPQSPAAEVEIDEDLVRRLLEAQHPDLADRPLEVVGAGWDNTMVRLGNDLVVRLPRRAVAATLVRNEQRALPVLGPRLPLPIPTPVRTGEPSDDFPWSWSVIPWIEGEEAVSSPPADADVDRFVAFLRALHQPAPADAPENPVRGVPLVERREAIEGWLEDLRSDTSVVSPAIERAWQDALAAPVAETDVWLHGDLHPRNVLVDGGRFAAIIDWGDVTSGDAACDLASIWMLFEDPAVRAAALDRYGADDALRRRAVGSAIGFAAILLGTGRRDAPRHARIGETTFRRLESDLASTRSIRAGA